MEAFLILRDTRVAIAGDRTEHADVASSSGRIRAIGTVPGKRGLDASGYLVLPGLVNAHDHLEFNLFPRLGAGPYESASAWATDIHRRFTREIEEVLATPLQERLVWGGIKNLVSGVTTVCHHNPWNRVFGSRFPVRVARSFGWAHSLEFAPDLRTRHAECPETLPFVFHAGEAVNGAGEREMNTLADLGLFAANSVMVHAVGLTRDSLALARSRGCSVVWCPSSNVFTLGRTLPKYVLESDLPIALGTDSALTAGGDMLDEIRFAQRISGLSDLKLYGMVADGAARVLRLIHGEGTIQRGGVADLLLFRDRGLSPGQTLLSQTPEAVFIGGTLQLVSADLAARWRNSLLAIARFYTLKVEGRGEMFIRTRVPPLPPGLRMAGKQVTTV